MQLLIYKLFCSSCFKVQLFTVQLPGSLKLLTVTLCLCGSWRTPGKGTKPTILWSFTLSFQTHVLFSFVEKKHMLACCLRLLPPTDKTTMSKNIYILKNVSGNKQTNWLLLYSRDKKTCGWVNGRFDIFATGSYDEQHKIYHCWFSHLLVMF